MKKIGFIDHHLNNFHANIYLKHIREGRFKDMFDVTYAYGEVEKDGVSSEKWCADNNVTLLNSPREVVEQSDCIVVLSPDNSERHYDLSEAALKSGKRVYVDKTFAPDFDTAVRMIELAQQHDTKMYTTSALRYIPEIHDYLNGIGLRHSPRVVAVRGPSTFKTYAVHCLEPLVMLLGHGAESVRFLGGEKFMTFDVSYPDGRMGMFSLFEPACAVGDKYCGHPFQASVMFGQGSVALNFTDSNMFKDLAEGICEFFDTGISPASFEDTLEIMALIDAGQKAMSQPEKWVKVPESPGVYSHTFGGSNLNRSPRF